MEWIVGLIFLFLAGLYADSGEQKEKEKSKQIFFESVQK